MGAQFPDGLSPLEKALIDTLQNLHADTIRELRAFRIQFLGALCGMVVFLISIVATLKGVDPTTPAAVVPTVLGGSAP